MAIISVDGHVKAPRAKWRDYVESGFHDDFDDWLRSQEGTPDAGNMNPEIGETAQWDSDQRLRDLESQGVIAEVLFPNGVPFQMARFEDFGRATRAELTRQGELAYNRWLADFCAEAPGRRAGQALVSFADIDAAVKDVYWAKEHGLGGISMPGLYPGGTNYFDPRLDPVWDAIQETGLPISQHGGAGLPGYSSVGFATIMTLAIESSIFSGRSLWQMILGGVFDRYPGLRISFIETGARWVMFKIKEIDGLLSQGDDWMGFAKIMGRERPFSASAAEYWDRHGYAGVSPFGDFHLHLEDITPEGAEHKTDYALDSDKVMFGVDYPHFESIFPNTLEVVAGLASLPEADLRKVLYENAADLYGFDVDELRPVIERVGFHYDDLRAGATVGTKL